MELSLIEQKIAEIDAWFLTTMNLLAANNNVKISSIDMETRTINFSSPPENEVALSMDIDRIYKEYRLKMADYE